MKRLVDIGLIAALVAFSGFNLFFAGSTDAIGQSEAPCPGPPPSASCTCCTAEEVPVWVCD
jgi:hypothetical protein